MTEDRWRACLASLFAFCLAVWPPLWILDPFHLIQSSLVIEQFAIAELGLCLAWAILARWRSGRTVFRGALAFALLVLCGWLVARYPVLTFAIYGEGEETLVLSCLMMLVCFVAGWFLAGRGLTVLIGLFLAYGLLALNFPATFSAVGGAPRPSSPT